MCVVCFSWQCVLLVILRGKVCYWVSKFTMSVDGSFRWQCVLYILVGKVSCWVF